MSSWRAIGGKCRALMAAAKSSSTPKKASSTPKRPNGVMKIVPISPALSSFIGSPETSRAEAVKKVWQYIKQNNLQNPANKREILCDENLKALFNGKDSVGFLEVASLLTHHFVKKG
ncbi:unnamed protein product [Amaranthus hypochondriacus]